MFIHAVFKYVMIYYSYTCHSKENYGFCEKLSIIISGISMVLLTLKISSFKLLLIASMYQTISVPHGILAFNTQWSC